MSLTKKTSAAALASTLVLAMPAAALAGGGGPGHGGQGAGARGADRDVPSRIASKLRAAERALDRAEERADDGNAAGAVSQLGSVRKNLASGTKSALKRVVAGNETGIPSSGAVASTDHRVVAGTVALLDGAGDEVVAGSSSTLDAALDGRDSVVAAITALADRSDYEGVLEDVADDAADEAETIGEALSDDTLTDDAKAALNAALTQVQATAAAASAAAGTSPEDAAGDPGAGASTQPVATNDRGRDCPPGRGRGGDGQQQRPSTTQEAPATYPGQV